MSFTRRTFLIGAGTGISVLVLSACGVPEPPPIPSPTSPPPSSVPEPAKLWRSAWTADPFSRGSVSYLRPGSSPEDRQAMRSPLRDRVFFAGEAISDQPGTVQGAVASGARAAREVIGTMATRERIAIVGAGAAGAEAARVLTALGLEVIVIEARERIGGRIDTRREDDGTTFELGAWQLASDAAGHILAEAGSVALEGVVEVTAAGKTSRGSIAELNAVQSDVSARLDQWASADSTEDSGLARALTDSGASAAAGTVGDIPPEAMRALYIEAVRLASGAEPADVSAWFPPPEIGAASVIPTGGLDSIVAAGLDGATVALSTAVVAVAYNDDGVSLRLGTGESRRVDRVILTLPLGVLKADAVEFEPPLPLSVRSSIDAVDVGHIEIVRVAFDEAFWTTKAAIWNLLGSDAPISTWINLQPLTGQTVLLGIAAGDAAASLSDVDDAALSLMVREMLAPFAA